MTPEQRARLRIRWWYWLIAIPIFIGFLWVLAVIDGLYSEPNTARPIATPTISHYRLLTPAMRETPRASACLRNANCFKARKAEYRKQARDGCWRRIEINLANSGLTEQTRYVGGDLPTLRYFGKEPPGADSALWLINMEFNNGSVWKPVQVECLYNHVKDSVASVQVW